MCVLDLTGFLQISEALVLSALRLRYARLTFDAEVRDNIGCFGGIFGRVQLSGMLSEFDIQ
jgi:hypothetical protein